MSKIIIALVCIFILGIFILSLWLFRKRIKELGISWYLKAPYPKYTVTAVLDIPVQMPDGKHLMTNIYLPKKSGKFPAILARTPYAKTNPEYKNDIFGSFFASHGYCFVIQDVRGKIPSEGSFYPHLDDIKDGENTIEWIIQQPWSNGEVSCFGFSYVGLTAWQASQSKAVRTIVPWFTGSNPFKLWYLQDKVPFLKAFTFWCMVDGTAVQKKIFHDDVDEALKDIENWGTLDTKLTGETIPAFRDFLAHDSFGPFWQKFSHPIAAMAHDFPALLGAGWFDQFLTNMLGDFKELRKSPEGTLKRQSCIIIGPWTHNPIQRIADFGLDSHSDFKNLFVQILYWHNKWMKNDSSVVFPPVTYYLMGKNEWRTATDWPPPEAKQITAYFDPDALNFSKPMTGERVLTFIPKKLVPAFGGHMLSSNGKEGPLDQSFLKEREDVLLWSSSPLEQDLTIVGAVEFKLYVETELETFDLMVKLIDIPPQGVPRLITNGYKRFEISSQQVVLNLSLMDTAYLFKEGHQLQVAITHSHFPSYAPNKRIMHLEQASIHFLFGPDFPSQFLARILEPMSKP